MADTKIKTIDKLPRSLLEMLVRQLAFGQFTNKEKHEKQIEKASDWQLADHISRSI